MTEEMLDEQTMDEITAEGEIDGQLKEKIVRALATVEDPELGIDIVNLGLVYGIEREKNGDTRVTMTLTAVGCPLAGMIVSLVKEALEDIQEVHNVEVDIIWDPPWTKERMSRTARIALGM